MKDGDFFEVGYRTLALYAAGNSFFYANHSGNGSPPHPRFGKKQDFSQKEPQESPAVETVSADWVRTGVQVLRHSGQRADDCLLGGLFVAHCVYAVLGLIGGVPLCPACSAGAGVWKGNPL